MDWKQRQATHKYNFFNLKSLAHNLKLYETIRANGGWDAIEKTPIEEYECDGTTQAHIREEHWRREYDAQLNMKRAHRTEEEHRQYNNEYLAEYRTKNRVAYNAAAVVFYNANRDTINQRKSEKIRCECGATICRGEKARHLRSKRHSDNLAEQQQNIMLL